MYSKRPGLIIGFHGCDKKVRDLLIKSSSSFKKSENRYDWLGHGMYFWENDHKRALEFAEFRRDNPKTAKTPIKKACVIGAVINLGFCLDLLDSSSIQLLNLGYGILSKNMQMEGLALPKNKPLKGGQDLIYRNLDCSVIQTLHLARKEANMPDFDSVRGVFWEGDNVYKNAGFKEKNHIQICIRNPNCIKGFFVPRQSANGYNEI